MQSTNSECGSPYLLFVTSLSLNVSFLFTVYNKIIFIIFNFQIKKLYYIYTYIYIYIYIYLYEKQFM